MPSFLQNLILRRAGIDPATMQPIAGGAPSSATSGVGNPNYPPDIGGFWNSVDAGQQYNPLTKFFTTLFGSVFTGHGPPQGFFDAGKSPSTPTPSSAPTPQTPSAPSSPASSALSGPPSGAGPSGGNDDIGPGGIPLSVWRQVYNSGRFTNAPAFAPTLAQAMFPGSRIGPGGSSVANPYRDTGHGTPNSVITGLSGTAADNFANVRARNII